jgi:hypothetical protein
MPTIYKYPTSNGNPSWSSTSSSSSLTKSSNQSVTNSYGSTISYSGASTGTISNTRAASFNQGSSSRTWHYYATSTGAQITLTITGTGGTKKKDDAQGEDED